MNPFLLPLSAPFRVAVALRHSAYQRGWLETRRLGRPVVSVGNLTVGGTGKTPLVAYVARILLARGWKPGILTRGYGRRSRSEVVVVDPEAKESASALDAGDEPTLLARQCAGVPVIVCADRFQAGRIAEERFQVNVHILDDGFQHLALARDVDLVALDSTETISDWRLLPAGRQREPLSALRRAQIMVLTRTDSADSKPLEDIVSRVSPTGKVFHSRTQLLRCRDVITGEVAPAATISAQRAAAFCGIGNPRAFFLDLRRSGFNVVAEHAFPDHHVYTVEEIRRLAASARRQGAAALVTTEKDAVKFPRDWMPELPIWVCEIAAEIQEAEEFDETLLACLAKAH